MSIIPPLFYIVRNESRINLLPRGWDRCISKYNYFAMTTSLASAMIDVSSSQLCASCEHCRTKKTKCDGKSPCSNCVARYLKLNKIKR